MSITISSNSYASSIANVLNRVTKDLNETSLRISTGKRILSAADDPAGMAMASKLNSDNSSYGVVKKNISSGLSLIEVSSKALETTTGLIDQMKKLAVEASSDTLSTEQRAAVQATFLELQGQLDGVVNNAKIFGKNLIGTAASSVGIQSGINSGDTTTISIAKSDTTTLGINSGAINLSTTGGAAGAITALDAALTTVGTNQSILGAQQSGFNARLSNIDKLRENLEAAASRIEGADLAEETKKFSLLQTQQQLAIQTLSIANSFPQAALQLLR
jgi:flagellin